MRTFFAGDKVLFIENNQGRDIENNELKKGRIQHFNFNPRSVDISSKTGYHKSIVTFTLAETDSIERALEHIQKDMWVEYECAGETKIDKVERIKLNTKHRDRITVELKEPYYHTIHDTDIKKIYFYDPNKKGSFQTKSHDSEEMIKSIRDELNNIREEFNNRLNVIHEEFNDKMRILIDELKN